MRSSGRFDRRGMLRGLALAGGGLALSGCKLFDSLAFHNHPLRRAMEVSRSVTYHAHRALVPDGALAREYAPDDIRQPMRPNGTVEPTDETWRRLAADDFAAYRLDVGGLVARPLSLSLADLRAMPARTQITRHDCVEGWSCIAQWTGVPLSEVLAEAGPTLDARYVLFRCYDALEMLLGPKPYYETIDMVDARHPQTILAYDMNGARLPIANGAPLRVRVERQLGYKMAKYIRAIELIDSFEDIGDGRGSLWADFGYAWYAGI